LDFLIGVAVSKKREASTSSSLGREVKRHQSLNDYHKTFEATIKQSLKSSAAMLKQFTPELSEATSEQRFRLINEWMKTTTASLRDLQSNFETTMNGV